MRLVIVFDSFSDLQQKSFGSAQSANFGVHKQKGDKISDIKNVCLYFTFTDTNTCDKRNDPLHFADSNGVLVSTPIYHICHQRYYLRTLAAKVIMTETAVKLTR